MFAQQPEIPGSSDGDGCLINLKLIVQVGFYGRLRQDELDKDLEASYGDINIAVNFY